MKSIMFLLAFICSTAIAQTGPGGVASGTSSVLLWLDGKRVNLDGTNPAVGATMTNWYDKSGNGVNVANATLVPPMTVTYSANGPVFDNSGYMTGSDATFPTGNAARTVIVCASSPSTTTDDVLFFYGSANNNQSYGILKIGTSNGVRSFFFGNDQDVGGGFTPSGTMKIITSTYTSNTQITYVNNDAGTSRTPGATVNTTLGTQGLQIGGWNSFELYSQATIGEVILYNKVLNQAERIIVNNYLAAKFGLTLSANDLYDNDNAANGHYDYDVAGIGQSAAGSANIDAKGSIVQINTATDLENGEYYIWGHDNGALVPTTSGVPAGVQARLTRIWRGSQTGGDGIFSFDVQFDMTGLGTVVAGDLRLLIDRNNDGLFSDETVAGGGIVSGAALVSGNIYEFAAIQNLDNDIRFTLATANTSTTPLPIKLESFKATPKGNNVKLEWITAAEKDNHHFTIDRSRDGLVFEEVGTVPGKQNSDVKRTYHLMDTNPFAGTSYYRLSQTDVDGTTEHFPIVSIAMKESGSEIEVHPNPTEGEFYIDLIQVTETEAVDVIIYNQQGLEVFSRSFDTQHKIKVPISIPRDKIPAGIYHLRIRSGDQVEVKLLLIK